MKIQPNQSTAYIEKYQPNLAPEVAMFKVVVLLCFLTGVQLCHGSEFNTGNDQQSSRVGIDTDADEGASAATISDADPESPGLQSVRSRVLGNLKEHSLVRLRVNTEDTLIGNFLHYQDNVVTIIANSIEKSVDEPAVDALWVRGRAGSTGALTGAILGCAAGLVFGLLAHHATESTDANVNTEGVVALTGVGAAVGALLGFGIGSSVPKWHLKFESP